LVSVLTGLREQLLPENLFEPVTGAFQECFVDVLDAGAQVGDDHAVRTLCDGEREFAQLLFHRAALGDIHE
jgi:hypothetical protein